MAVLHSIAVTNESTVVSDAEVQAAMPALQYQANYHFRPFWDAGCRMFWVPKGQPVPAGMWKLGILDDTDQAGALGWHDFAGGVPILKIFAGTDLQYGLSWTITTSHEVLEALADPDIVRAEQVTDTKFYATEICDAVEDDSLGYAIKTATGAQVLVSDFILPAWFRPGLTAMRYDFKQHCSKPLQILPGGYHSIYVSGQGWTQVTNFQGQLADITHLVPKSELHGRRPRVSQELRQKIAAGQLAVKPLHD